MRLTILPWLLWFFIVVTVIWATKAYSAPIYQATSEGITVVLTDEPCKFHEVVDLPRRALWTENGKTFEGCWGAHPAFPIVLAYFSDKSVVALPKEMFTKVIGV